MTNEEVSEILQKYADLLEARRENPYRVKAYRKAALGISKATESLHDMAREGSLTTIKGVGKDLSRKIEEILSTGTISLLEKGEGEVPEELSALMAVPGLPLETARFLYFKLRIQEVEDLEKLARSHLLRTLPGVSQETERSIIKGLSQVRH